MYNISQLMSFKAIDDLNESIKYVNEKNSKIIYSDLSIKIDTVLLDYYKNNKIITVTCRQRGKAVSYTGLIERIDLIYRELYLSPKKKISFDIIIGINDSL